MAVDDTFTAWQPLGQGNLNERIRSEILRVLETRRLSPATAFRPSVNWPPR